ncbi:hypothetical protein EDEG_00645 [Edhazardia aedis USNM 41457]|uniref:Hydroxymethylglutaryl-CoA synthase n=1 Tax=Edhazardia aedis (strain USNM 41457) TaxID=1003232 RepID=J9DVH2_EDHAE|nr:hypothetical protein EDEG_00645 [Edhazardia aedis USNM 41457]|eukprot:EJW05287.1 hypothetical protein EDEG_00645 [Edhazardia aedis USNM 41457]
MSKKYGIIGFEYALPTYYISHDDLAHETSSDPNKYKIGLDLHEMGVPSPKEDVVSLALTATKRLLKKYNVNVNAVGKVEVGTESNFDTSKSIKTYIMQLFENTKIQGADTTNACYGGCNALINCLTWVESRFNHENKMAIVVCTDISVHNFLPAVPTSGAGAVAILIGENPVFRVHDIMSHYSTNTYDFCKPISNFPYCILDAPISLDLYLKAFKQCYNDVKNTYKFDYMCCHTPYPKLVKKALVSCDVDPEIAEKSLIAGRRNANSYTVSVFLSLISILSHDVKIGEKIGLFSFGSGCVSTIMCLEKVADGCDDFSDFNIRLDKRIKMDPKRYLKMIQSKHDLKDYVPIDDVEIDGFYLESISGYKRSYKYN